MSTDPLDGDDQLGDELDDVELDTLPDLADDDLDDEDDDEDDDGDADEDDESNDNESDDDGDADEDDESDDDEVDDGEEAEESLDVLLAREKALDEDDIARISEESRGGLAVRAVPVGAGEFTCRSCFLVKRRAQLADEKKLYCFDCV